MYEMILLNPDEVWDYFYSSDTNFDDFNELIAYNEAFGVEIYLGSSYRRPVISVMIDDSLEFEDFAMSKADCTKIVSDIYNKYLMETVFDSEEVVELADDDESEEETEASIIDDNEDELDSAVIDFLVTTTKLPYIEVTRIPKNIREDLKDHFLEYMYRKHGIEPYRPMIIEYDKGDEEFSCNPYKNLEFDAGYLVYPTTPPVFDISKLKDN